MVRIETAFLWWHSDRGVLPSADTPAWTLTGAGTVNLTDAGADINDNSNTQPCHYERPFLDSDPLLSSRAREGDILEIQAEVTGQSFVSAWSSASGASGNGLLLSDGRRHFLLSIGDKLALIDPDTGQIYVTMAEHHPWTGQHLYRLQKVKTEGWRVWLNGTLLAEVPYLLAPTTSGRARVAFGSFDNAGQAHALFEQIEAGLNAAVPPQDIVDRLLYGIFPIPVIEAWNAVSRGLLRTIVGMFQDGREEMERIWYDLTARRLPFGQEFSFSGWQLPSLESVPWTLSGSSHLDIVRRRLRCTPNGIGSTPVGAIASFTVPDVSLVPDDTEYALGGTWIVWSNGLDVNWRMGPVLQIDNTDRVITAQLVSDGSTLPSWVLTTSALTGAYTAIGTPWPVNARAPHRVEIQVLGRAVVLLLVDGCIVDRLKYSNFSASVAATPTALIGCAPRTTCTADLTDAEATRSLSDPRGRPLLQQAALERQIPVGGREGNAELEVFSHHQYDLQRLRGTTAGFLAELRRLTQTDTAFLICDEESAAWCLSTSWPHITPVFLGSSGYMRDVYAEFTWGNTPNFTLDTFAVFLARYLLPRSTLELTYYVCLITVMTGAPATVGSNLRLTVSSTAEFEAGDAITIRLADNSDREETTIAAIISETEMDIPTGLTGSYSSGDVVRKVLRQS